jgi:hypothetical protein
VFSLGVFFGLLETWAIEFGKKEKKENPITITIILNGKTKVKGCHAMQQ